MQAPRWFAATYRRCGAGATKEKRKGSKEALLFCEQKRSKKKFIKLGHGLFHPHGGDL
jgi:hypothetical protein